MERDLGPAADRAQLRWEAHPERTARWSGSDHIELGFRVPGPGTDCLISCFFLTWLCVGGSPAGLLKL